jgi:hypothetical protein
LLQAYADFGDWMVKQQLDPGPPLLGGRERAAYVGFFTLRSPTLAVPRVAGALGVVAMLGGFALGIAGLTAALVASPRTRDARTSPGDAAVTLVWLGCVLGAVTAWIPVVWDRYVLPPSVAVDLCVALGPAGVGLGIRGRRRVRLLAVAATATGLAALTARVADPRWIDPRAMPTIRDREVQQTYVDAANERPACVTLQQHAATLHLMRAEGTQAADRIDRALALVGPLPPDRPALVRRCTLTRDLVRARLMAHDQPGAAEAAAAYVDALERIDAGLHTSDPMVRAAFDALTTNAQALATRLRPPS